MGPRSRDALRNIRSLRDLFAQYAPSDAISLVSQCYELYYFEKLLENAEVQKKYEEQGCMHLLQNNTQTLPQSKCSTVWECLLLYRN